MSQSSKQWPEVKRHTWQYMVLLLLTTSLLKENQCLCCFILENEGTALIHVNFLKCDFLDQQGHNAINSEDWVCKWVWKMFPSQERNIVLLREYSPKLPDSLPRSYPLRSRQEGDKSLSCHHRIPTGAGWIKANLALSMVVCACLLHSGHRPFGPQSKLSPQPIAGAKGIFWSILPFP